METSLGNIFVFYILPNDPDARPANQANQKLNANG